MKETILAAFNPGELKATQASLKHWLTEKRDSMLEEESEFNRYAAEAKLYKWKASPLVAAGPTEPKHLRTGLGKRRAAQMGMAL